MSEDGALAEWSSHVSNISISLDRTAFLIAKTLQYHSLDIGEMVHTIDAMGDELKRFVRGKERTTEMIAAINEYLFQDMGFKGNAEDYYDPRNSYLNDVIARRKGIPITLSVLYIELARRIGLGLQGVGFPAHFLVKYADTDLEVVLDPFNKGRIVTGEDCQALLDQLYNGQVKFEKKFLDAVTNEQIVIRMLRNLKDAFAHSYDYGKSLTATEMILAIEPRLPEEIRDKGLLLYHMGRYSDALPNLSKYIEMEPEAMDIDAVLQVIREIRNNRREG